MHARGGQRLWSIPYPQEVNDIPMIIGRQMDGKAFAELVTDHFEEMLQLGRRQPLAMGIALQPTWWASRIACGTCASRLKALPKRATLVRSG